MSSTRRKRDNLSALNLSATLLPWHGWVTQKSFEVAVNAAPDWADVLPVLAPTHAEFKADVDEWVRTSQKLLGRVTGVLRALDLEDVRKTV